MNLYNKGKREIETTHGKLKPSKSLPVPDEFGKKMISLYPRELMNASDITGNEDLEKRLKNIEAREKAVAEKEKAIKEKEKVTDQPDQPDTKDKKRGRPSK